MIDGLGLAVPGLLPFRYDRCRSVCRAVQMSVFVKVEGKYLPLIIRVWKQCSQLLQSSTIFRGHTKADHG